jgi:hypothetical protein
VASGTPATNAIDQPVSTLPVARRGAGCCQLGRQRVRRRQHHADAGAADELRQREQRPVRGERRSGSRDGERGHPGEQHGPPRHGVEPLPRKQRRQDDPDSVRRERAAHLGDPRAERDGDVGQERGEYEGLRSDDHDPRGQDGCG